MNLSIPMALETFERAVDAAQVDRSNLPEVGAAFNKLLEAMNLTGPRLAAKIEVGVDTVEKWKSGTTFPRPGHVLRLRDLVRAMQKHPEVEAVISLLLDSRFNPVITFIVKDKKCTKEEIEKLFWLARMSQEPPTEEMMKRFLGRS